MNTSSVGNAQSAGPLGSGCSSQNGPAASTAKEAGRAETTAVMASSSSSPALSSPAQPPATGTVIFFPQLAVRSIKVTKASLKLVKKAHSYKKIEDAPGTDLLNIRLI